MQIFKYLFGFGAIACILFFAIGFFIPSFDYESSILVNKPVQEAFAVFKDESKLKYWMPNLKSIELIEGQKNKEGSKYKIVIEEDGKNYEIIEKIITFKENEQYTSQFVNEVMTIDMDVQFEENSGITEITSKSVITGKNILWKSVFPLSKGNFEKEDQELLDRLKKVIESN